LADLPLPLLLPLPLPLRDMAEEESMATDEGLLQYGVIHLRGAFSDREQSELCQKVRGCSRKSGEFCISSGDPGSSSRRDEFHELGDRLYARIAQELGRLREDQLAEPQWKRMALAYSGERPVSTTVVTGKPYATGDTLPNHTDLDKPLYTMSLALGDACDFTIGKKTIRPRKNEINGTPVTVCMRSGDVMFFDGGSVPHSIDRIHNGTAPAFWTKDGLGVARAILLFRAGQ